MLPLAASELIGASAAPDRHVRRPAKPLVASLMPAIAAAGLLLSGLAQGATIAVDATGAVADTDNGNCSLIEAIQSANTDTAEDACTSGDGADTITLPEDSTHTLQAINNTELDGPSGLPVITTTITIQGAGATIQRDPAAAAFRILAVSGRNTDAGDLTVNGITIRGGDAGSRFGGGVLVDLGNATFNEAVVKDNSTRSDGAGIDLETSTATFTKTEISNNETDNDGGGIYVFSSTATITETEISNNEAGDDGGGIYVFSSTATITETEISNNAASDQGGGIFSEITSSDFTLTLANSTVSGNTAPNTGGGLYNGNGLTVVENSTVTGNDAPTDGGAGIASFGRNNTKTRLAGTVVAGNNGTDADFVGDAFNSFTSNGDNLIGTGNATAAFSEPGDTTGVADPGLGPLAANGGPTRTHAVRAGSPALDAIPNSRCPPPAVDQRGVTRPADGDLSGDALCDIGAFELADSDGDGTLNSADAFPADASEDTDTDGDGIGDNADAFPNDPSEDTDTDGDGTGDNADAFPNDPSEDTDTDNDGVGNNADPDDDGDGLPDADDPEPLVPREPAPEPARAVPTLTTWGWLVLSLALLLLGARPQYRRRS